jgi:HEAT repeat protein
VTRAVAACVLCLACGRAAGAEQLPQEPKSPQTVSSGELNAAIDRLGKLDYDVRTSASRVIRRTQAAQVVPVLIDAAAAHADGYVRYRALVLLTGFNDSRTTASMQAAMTSPNDRLRAVSYSFFEHHPDQRLGPRLLSALDQEPGEFVRPSLVRALAALGSVTDDVRIREALVREAGRGQDFFRSVVIEALGDYKAQYAFDALMRIARIDGPLQSDTAIALGKIGDQRALDVLSALGRTAPKASQPYIAAGLCLLGVNCPAHLQFLIETLKFSDRNQGYQDHLRASAGALAQLAVSGSPLERGAIDVLFEAGVPSGESTRAPVSLALATIALRRTPAMLTALEARTDRDNAIALLAEGFDGLTEDYEKERFFALVRRSYWEAPEGSPRRTLMQTLIRKLDF